MPVLIEAALYGVMVPVVVAGAILMITFRSRAPDRDRSSTGWAVALALGAGYVAGYLTLLGLPPFPPVEANQWIVLLAIVAALLALVDSFHRTPGWLRHGLRLLLSFAVPWLVLGPMREHTWSTGESLLWSAGSGLVLFGLITAAETTTRQSRGVSMPLSLLTLGVGTSLVLALSGSALLGQLGGVLSAALGAVLVFAWWRPDVEMSRGPAAVVLVVLAGLWLSGYFYAEVPAASALLLLGAPGVVWLVLLTPLRRVEKPWKLALVRTTAMLIPVAIAVVIALGSGPEELAAGSYDYAY